MNLGDLHPSTSLKSSDFDEVGEMTLTIRKIEIRDIGQEGEKETKPVLTFDETEKTLVLNKTNANLIGAQYGDKNIDVAWIGKQITLHVEQTTFQGKATPGIRVKQSNATDEFWEYATDTMFLSPEGEQARWAVESQLVADGVAPGSPLGLPLPDMLLEEVTTYAEIGLFDGVPPVIDTMVDDTVLLGVYDDTGELIWPTEA